jgi:hypothetical protein
MLSVTRPGKCGQQTRLLQYGKHPIANCSQFVDCSSTNKLYEFI